MINIIKKIISEVFLVKDKFGLVYARKHINIDSKGKGLDVQRELHRAEIKLMINLNKKL